MARAVLQLHDNPWLSPKFRTGDLLFLTQASTNSTSLFNPAYISQSFTMSATIPIEICSNGQKFAKNPYVFALGVALVELSYGASLLSLAPPDELDAQGFETPNTEMLVADWLVRNIRNRELDNYALATASCVQCDMGYPFSYSLEEGAFKAKFLERVLDPSQDDCKGILPSS